MIGRQFIVQSLHRVAAATAFVVALASVASASEIVIGDGKASPESLAVGPGGVLYVGSSSTPFVYRVAPGATTATTFIDASAEGAGTTFLGMLVDASTGMR